MNRDNGTELMRCGDAFEYRQMDRLWNAYPGEIKTCYSDEEANESKGRWKKSTTSNEVWRDVMANKYCKNRWKAHSRKKRIKTNEISQSKRETHLLFHMEVHVIRNNWKYSGAGTTRCIFKHLRTYRQGVATYYRLNTNKWIHSGIAIF